MATLKIMRGLVRRGKKNIEVRMAAVRAVAGLKDKDWRGEAGRIHSFVRDDIRYVRDIRGVETIHTPERILDIGQGDCDDKSVLLASMLESIGHPTRFVAVAFGHKHFSHVLVETKIGSRWIACETTMPWKFGRYPPKVTNRMEVHN